MECYSISCRFDEQEDNFELENDKKERNLNLNKMREGNRQKVNKNLHQIPILKRSHHQPVDKSEIVPNNRDRNLPKVNLTPQPISTAVLDQPPAPINAKHINKIPVVMHQGAEHVHSSELIP